MATASSSESTVNLSYFDHFTCNICLEVLQEPVQCVRNEHYFCKSCITQHLTRSQTCPVCQDCLTTTTLRRTSRVVASLLQQFQSPKCRYANRGCTASVRHEVLLAHHQECGFAPVQCSNEGCKETVNRQDLACHERESCDFRSIACEECNERMNQREYVRHPCSVLKETDKNKHGLVELRTILREIQDEQRRQGVEIQNLAAEIVQLSTAVQASQQGDAVQGLARKLVLSNATKRQQSCVLKQHAKETRQCCATEQQKNRSNDCASISRHLSSRAQTKTVEDQLIFVAGGSCGWWNDDKSCEIFNWSTRKWYLCKATLFFNHADGFSFVFDNKVVLCGGTYTNRIECVDISSDTSTSALPSLLPDDCGKGALYGDTILTVGDSVSKISLKPPYETTIIRPVFEKGTELSSHGVAYVENHGVVIVGGCFKSLGKRRRDEVLLYNPATNKLHKLAPLPYKVADMAVLAYKDNVIILGGETSDNMPSNDVLMYNITSQQCSRLPNMLEARSNLAAVMMEDTIVVIGGSSWETNGIWNKDYKALETAEYLVLGKKAWKTLPPMQFKRDGATACVLP